MRINHNQLVCHLPENKTRITGNCVFTNKKHEIVIPTDEFESWHLGDVLIQNAMPSVSAEDREFLISGISPEGWKQTFKEEE